MRRVIAAVIVVGVGMLGCQTRPIPLSAQRGSTVVIPLSWGTGLFGYGGTEYTDYQRGQMVFRLDSLTGFELTTRFSTIAVASPRASFGATATSAGGQVVSLVDIPVGAPLGTHALYVVRKLGTTE